MNNDILLDEQLSQEPFEMRDAYLASSGKRFANYIVDIIIIYVILFVFGGILGLINVDFIDSFFTRVAIYLLLIFYYTLFEFFTKGKTIGKLITGTRAVRVDGKSVTFGNAFIRSISRLIPLEAFSCLGSPPKGWHDRFASTRVIDEKAYRVNET